MKALSLRQPWAWAVIFAGKRIENRKWPWLKRGFENDMSSGIKRGEYVAIHASATKPNDYDWAGVELALDRMLTSDEQDFVDKQRGHIIGVAQVCGILRTTADMEIVEDGHFPHYVMREDDIAMFVGEPATPRRTRQIDQLKRWWMGPYAFWLTDVQAVNTPIAAKGALNFWEVPTAMEAQLMADLAPAFDVAASN